MLLEDIMVNSTCNDQANGFELFLRQDLFNYRKFSVNKRVLSPKIRRSGLDGKKSCISS